MAPPHFWRGEEKPRIISPVVVKMPPNYSLVEISSPENEEEEDEEEDLSAMASPSARKGSRGKNARQLTWVLLLRAHRAAGFLTSLAAAVRRRIAAGRTDAADEESLEKDPRCRGKLYSCISFFLLLFLAILSFEVAVHFNGWSLRAAIERAHATWITTRAAYLAPPLQHLANVCVILFLIQSLDRLILCIGCFWIKLKKIKPVAGAGQEDPEAGEYYPRVLVQIPMCNEKEVYQQSIAAVCGLEWPPSELLIQVLDDSDEEATRGLIEEEVARWRRSGVNIVYRHREVREGYKAGNLKSAMDCGYVREFEFVAIFDADFKPFPDFLKKTVPHFKGKERVGLVQARWGFVNRDENLLTRLQNVNLCFHFEVEQQVNGIFLDFFGFNGTAGVWRIEALRDAGGWMDRTTVEDMDIAVRAHLRGWKFVFLNHVECQCELPESYEAYRKQQHRWHSGPMHLFRLCLRDILRSEIGFWKKSNLIFLFFLLRKLILPFYSFTLFCILLPMTMFVPEAELPTWVVCYVPATMSFLNVLPSPRSFPFIVPYLLFENTMSVTKFNAMVSGLLRLGSAYEWVVTKKSGRSSDGDLLAMAELGFHKEHKRKKKRKKKKHNRIYRKELALAFLLLTAAARSLLSAQGIHFYFLLFQGVSFLLVGLDLIGEQVE